VIVETGGPREEWPPAVTAALALEALALGVFAVIWQLTGPERGAGIVAVLIGRSGLAMGIQSAAVRRLGGPGIAMTYITGTLTSLVVDLMGWLRSRAVPLAAAPAAGHATANWEQRVGLLGGIRPARSSPFGDGGAPRRRRIRRGERASACSTSIVPRGD
jgi:uncharacterized membrane protein YoaK (UPF0700 family)